MFLEKAAQWENLLDLVALASCCLVLLFLVWNRIRYRRWVMRIPTTAGTDHRFGTELSTELLRQRVRKTHDAVSRALEQELGLFVDGLSGGTRVPSAFNPAAEKDGGAAVWASTGIPGERDSDYYFAFKMAANGASVESIRSRAELSEGEAELIFNLQRFQTGN